MWDLLRIHGLLESDVDAVIGFLIDADEVHAGPTRRSPAVTAGGRTVTASASGGD